MTWTWVWRFVRRGIYILIAVSALLVAIRRRVRIQEVNFGETRPNDAKGINETFVTMETRANVGSPSISLVNFRFRGPTEVNAPAPSPPMATPTLAKPLVKSEPQPPYPANFHYLRVEDMHLLTAGQCGSPNSNCEAGGCSPGNGATTCLSCLPNTRPSTYCASFISLAQGNCPFCSAGRFAASPTASCQSSPPVPITDHPSTTPTPTAVNPCIDFCAAGSYANNGGTLATFGATACSPCGIGHTNTASTNVCNQCKAGYSGSGSATPTSSAGSSCSACESGTWVATNQAGTTATVRTCATCTAGSYANIGGTVVTSAATACTACATGYTNAISTDP